MGGFPHAPKVILFQLGPGRLSAALADVDDNVTMPAVATDPVKVEQRTQSPPCPVAHHRRAGLSRRRDSKTGDRTVASERENHDVPAIDLHALLVDGKKLGSAAELQGRQQEVSDGQPLATLAPPCRQDSTPTWRAHASAKAVSLLAPLVVRLERSLHLSNLT